MAGCALGRRGWKHRRVRMARVTRDFRVCTGERKADSGVIEERRLPIRARVARLTLHAQRVGVRIVLLMTAGACGADGGERRVCLVVAIVAGQRFVGSVQGKIAGLMVESR